MNDAHLPAGGRVNDLDALVGAEVAVDCTG
jgi:hypothetical protein